MAKKFVQVTGLNKVFASLANATAATPVIKSTVSSTVDANTILFITCDSDQAIFGDAFADGNRWIWARSKFYGDKGADASMTGYSIASSASSVLATDSIKTALGKLEKQLAGKQASGSYLTGVYGTGDTWINVTPSTAATKAASLTISHAGPGALSKTKGDTSDVTLSSTTKSFTVPYIGIDAKGHVIDGSSGTKTVTLPDTAFTDEKVKSENSTNKAYLLGHAAQGTTATAITESNVYMQNGELHANRFVGSLDASWLSGSISISNIGDGTIPNTKLTASSITLPGQTVSLGGTYTAGSVSNGEQKLVTGGAVYSAINTVKNELTNMITPSMEFMSVVSTLPTTLTAADKGHTYKTRANISISAAQNEEGVAVTTKEGDTIIWSGSKWWYIPSGDDTVIPYVYSLTTNGTSIQLKKQQGTSAAVVDSQITIAAKESTMSVVGDHTDVISIGHADSSVTIERNAQLEYGSDVIISVDTDRAGHITSITHAPLPYKYVHPKAGAGQEITSTSAGTIGWGSTNKVITGISVDASGHLVGYTTKGMPTQPTDTKVQNTASDAKSYLLGHTAQGINAASYTESDVYMQAGELHAAQLYEGTKNITESNQLDWGKI